MSDTVMIFRHICEIVKRDSYLHHILSLCCLPFCISVCIEKLFSHWMDFHEIWYLSIFQKPFKKSPVALKSDLCTLHEELCSFMISHRILFRINVSYKRCSKIKTYFLLSNFFPKIVSWDNVEKYGTGRQATCDNVLVHRKNLIYMLDN